MRWHILRTLVYKEYLRHLANRGGIVLVLLLVVASMLLSFFGHTDASGVLTPGVQLCYIDYAEEGPLVAHLRHHVPADLRDHVRFRPIAAARTDDKGTLVYPQGTGAIQLRPAPGGMRVWFWHPGDRSALAPFEIWFWQAAYSFAQSQRARSDTAASLPPVLQAEYSALENGLDPRSGMATALVLFGLFFVCVYLLPSLTCEERERGVLLAQALSPASPREVLGAKFLFYPILGLALAAVLAGTYRPVVLTRPFFWLALTAVVAGSMGIGLTIASLARTQRAASMGAMCYMLAVAVLLLICQQNNIAGLPYLALEYHGPRMLHAALTGTVLRYHWGHLAATIGLAVVWTTLATVLFRRRGWQ
jgi:ABC-type Na+ efflux pump permease subunit